VNRRLHYFCTGWPNSWLATPLNIAQALALRASVQTCHHGIRISHLTKGEPAVFVRATTSCLDLIRQSSPLHFRRLQRHVSYTADSAISRFAMYLAHSRAVKLDFAKYWLPDHRDLSLRIYAMTLLHEATHGYLCAHIIPYTKRTRSRVERICEGEANRFLRHLGREWSSLHLTFSEDGWQIPWHASAWEKARLQLERPRHEFTDG
jgi:hypothetical protein